MKSEIQKFKIFEIFTSFVAIFKLFIINFSQVHNRVQWNFLPDIFVFHEINLQLVFQSHLCFKTEWPEKAIIVSKTKTDLRVVLKTYILFKITKKTFITFICAVFKAKIWVDILLGYERSAASTQICADFCNLSAQIFGTFSELTEKSTIKKTNFWWVWEWDIIPSIPGSSGSVQEKITISTSCMTHF